MTLTPQNLVTGQLESGMEVINKDNILLHKHNEERRLRRTAVALNQEEFFPEILALSLASFDL
jgi:hypothetical protein